MCSVNSIRVSLIIGFLLVWGSGGSANGACGHAPANWSTDDVVTMIYDISDGSFFIDNPAGDDAAADAITTFELTSSIDFFTGPAPAGFDGLFDVWSAQKAFTLKPDGFFDMSWPPGSVKTDVAEVCDVLTLSGSFLSGGGLEPVDLFIVPEPSGLVLFGLAVLGLAGIRRRI